MAQTRKIPRNASIGFLSLPLVLSLASMARAQVDCDTPDDLCVGDPCTVGTVIVDSSCTLDFGARTVVVAGRLRIPSDGQLSLSAAAIRVDGSIESLRPIGTPSGGPQIHLTATGNIDLGGRLRLLGAQAGAVLPGDVQLEAGNDLTFRGSLTATTSPTLVVLRAVAGDLSFTGRVNASRAGSEVQLAAGGDATLHGSLRQIDDIDVDAGGAANLGGSMTPRASLTVDAGGAATMDTPIRALGADLAIHGAAGVTVKKPIYLTPLFLVDG